MNVKVDAIRGKDGPEQLHVVFIRFFTLSNGHDGIDSYTG